MKGGLALAKPLFLLAALLGLSALPARAQHAGRVAVQAEAQILPQVGVKWNYSERIAARGAIYVQGDLDATFWSLSVLYHFPLDESLRTYAGPHADFFGSIETNGAYLGAALGAEYRLYDRFSVFGEFVPTISTEEDGFNMFSTGVGVLFYLNR